MLSEREIESFQESCSAVADQNWDGHVKVVQGGDGVLQITLYSEEDEVESHWTATPAGEFEGHALWTLKEAGDDHGVLTTLVPAMVVGLMGLT